METRHRNTTFIQCLERISKSVKTIEEEKKLLFSHSDFNLNDAFKMLALSKNKVGDYTQPSKQKMNDLELNAALLGLPGLVFTGDTMGCNLFCKTFASNTCTRAISFEDFIRAFLPCDLNIAKQLLSRPCKLTKT